MQVETHMHTNVPILPHSLRQTSAHAQRTHTPTHAHAHRDGAAGRCWDRREQMEKLEQNSSDQWGNVTFYTDLHAVIQRKQFHVFAASLHVTTFLLAP